MNADAVMSSPRELSPVEEYDRLQAERCALAGRLVDRWYLLTLVPYIGSYVVAVWPGAPLWTFGATFVLVFLCAVATGVLTFWNWSYLTWGKLAYGLAPWAFCLLVILPILVKTVL